MKNKKTLKFYIAIFIAKCASFTLKLLKEMQHICQENSITIVPGFLGMLENQKL